MKKKYILITTITLVMVITFITYFNYLKINKIYKEENGKSIEVAKSISMMLEQTSGVGDYKIVTQSNWPSGGYKFNSELSRCENDSTLKWDDTKKAIVISGNLSDKCYAYFDKIISIADYCTSGTYLSTCIKNFGDQGVDISNIYIHNSSLTNGAKDNSYRYAGTNPNNYVCFGSTASPCPNDNLYRIIGVIGNKVKLIKYDYANSNLLGTDGDYGTASTPDATYYKGSLSSVNTYYWNNASKTNVWSNSSLNKTNLNTNFINYLGTPWANKIATTTWTIGGNTSTNIYSQTPTVAYTNEITSPAVSTTYSAKIGLMYASDYGFAADQSSLSTVLTSYSQVKDTNWMFMGFAEWTITRLSESTNFAFNISKSGSASAYNVINGNGVRVVFNLESSVTYGSGHGTKDSPIRIEI